MEEFENRESADRPRQRQKLARIALWVVIPVLLLWFFAGSSKNFLAQTAFILEKTFSNAFESNEWEFAAEIPIYKESDKFREKGAEAQSEEVRPLPDSVYESSPVVTRGLGAPETQTLEDNTPSVPAAQESRSEVPKTSERVAPLAKSCAFEVGGVPTGSVVFNELAWMGTEAKPTAEWIELTRVSPSPVSLAGWHLMEETGDIMFVFPRTALLSREFYVLERGDDTAIDKIVADAIYRGAISNSGAWLKLFDSACVLVDELKATAGWDAFGGNNDTKQTLERNRGTLGWHTSVASGGTPARENSTPAVSASSASSASEYHPPALSSSSPAPQSSGESPTASPDAPPPFPPSQGAPPDAPARILVSEIFYDAEGSDSGKEFIELYNAGDGAIDITGWSLRNGTDSLATVGSKPEDRVSVPRGGFFLVGFNNWNSSPEADMKRAASLSNTSSTIVLVNSLGEVADSTQYNNSVSPGQSLTRVSWDSTAFSAQEPNPQNSLAASPP